MQVCTECRGEIPEKANRCMHCGHRQDSPVVVWLFGLLFVAVAVVVALYFLTR